MPTYTIQPTTLISRTASPWATVTDANFLAYLKDMTDTTYVTFNGPQGSPSIPKTDTVLWSLAAPTIASGEFVARVSGWMRTRYGAMDAANVQTGLQPYRATDSQPTTFQMATGSGISSTWVYKEPGYASVGWTPADCATLSLAWYIKDSGTFNPKMQISEVGAKIYTLAPGTSTPSNVTQTTSSYPVIPVAIAATIDWEATTTEAQGLRVVTTEVRIESGGAGPGLGTLVASQTYDKLFTTTGTQNVSVTFDAAVANGTYKVYARSIRHREFETSIAADQYGAWSSAATLTMNVPLPNTPTVSVTAQQADSRIKISVTPVATTSYTNPVVDVQRSDDNGVNWKSVRGGTGISATFGTAKDIYDYFPAKNQTVYYRARVRAAYTGGAYNPSAWSSSASAIIYATSWTLKSPDNPALNVLDLRVVNDPEEQLTEDVGVFRPLNGRYPTVVSGELGGWDGAVEVVCISNSEWLALKALLELQEPLVLESLFGWVKYIRVIGGAKVKNGGSSTQPVRNVTFSYVELGDL